MRYAIILLALACGSAQATPLSLENKTELAKGTKDSCLTNQAKEAANKNLTVAQLQDYCECYGNGFAGSMQTEDLDKNKDALTPETLKIANAVSQKCAVSTLKK